MPSSSRFGESEMKSKFVQVTSWASSEHHPDLTRGRWVMLGSPNIVTYILAVYDGALTILSVNEVANYAGKVV